MAIDMQEMKRLQQILQDRYAGWWEPMEKDQRLSREMKGIGRIT